MFGTVVVIVIVIIERVVAFTLSQSGGGGGGIEASFVIGNLTKSFFFPPFFGFFEFLRYVSDGLELRNLGDFVWTKKGFIHCYF